MPLSRRKLLQYGSMLPMVSGFSEGVYNRYSTPLMNPPPPEMSAIYTNSDGWFFNSGTVPTMPTTADHVLVWYVWKSTVRPSNTWGVAFNISNHQNPASNNSFQIRHFPEPYPTGPMGLSVGAVSADKKSNFGFGLIAGGGGTELPYDPNWHSNLIYFSPKTSSADFLFDGRPAAGYQTTAMGSPFAMQLSGSPIDYISVAGIDAPAQKLTNTAIAQFAFAALPGPINIRDPNVIAAFIDPVSGYPRRLASGGLIPIINPATGAVIQVIQVQILLSGNPDTFYLDHPSRTTDMAQAGLLTISPGDPAEFKIMGNVTAPPFADPWGVS